MTPKFCKLAAFLLVPVVVSLTCRPALGCTTAIFGPEVTLSGAPMIWKNRDTDVIQNKVIFVQEMPFSYLAVIDNDDTSGRWVYAGINTAGFAIFNSASYNLQPPAPTSDDATKNQKISENKDLEGRIMADALRIANSVDDFEDYLNKNLGANLGAQANFGVIDASGRAKLFEVSNHRYKAFDLNDFPEHFLVNTNFSRSGRPNEGTGYLRLTRATDIIKAHKGLYSPQFVMENLARDFGHSLLRTPTLTEIGKMSEASPYYIATTDTINREYTSAAIIIEGKRPGDALSQPIMWVALGEPLTSIAVPLFIDAKSSPSALHVGDKAAIYSESHLIAGVLRPFRDKERINYIDLTKLTNREGRGFLPKMIATQEQIYQETQNYMAKHRTSEELRYFQDLMADKALATLKAINSNYKTASISK